MYAYFIRRLLQSVVVVVLLSFVTFVLMGFMPGDPLDIACSANPDCTTENLAQMKANLGLDQSVYSRYLNWAENLIHGDFGYSRTYKIPVLDILLPRLINTIVLGVLVVIVSFIIAIPLGVFSSVKARTKFDYAFNFLSFLGISTPSFWLGLMFIILFSVKLGLLPAGGVESVGGNSDIRFFAKIFDRACYLILPVLTLSCLTIAGWARYTRSSMLEILRMDYMRTAKAKGLNQKDIVLKHGLKNAMIAIVTVVALDLPRIVSGAVITETVFSYQGIGKLMLDSILGNDFNVAMCSFLITCVSVIAMNFIADILYNFLDPRVKLR